MLGDGSSGELSMHRRSANMLVCRILFWNPTCGKHLGDFDVVSVLILKWILKCGMRGCEHGLLGEMAVRVGHGMNSDV